MNDRMKEVIGQLKASANPNDWEKAKTIVAALAEKDREIRELQRKLLNYVMKDQPFK